MVARGGGLWWHEVGELQVVWPWWVWDQRNLREELKGSQVRVREWWWWQVAGLGGGGLLNWVVGGRLVLSSSEEEGEGEGEREGERGRSQLEKEER